MVLLLCGSGTQVPGATFDGINSFSQEVATLFDVINECRVVRGRCLGCGAGVHALQQCAVACLLGARALTGMEFPLHMLCCVVHGALCSLQCAGNCAP